MISLKNFHFLTSGYPHEANRNDRDDYIDVDYEQLKAAEKENGIHNENLIKRYRKCEKSNRIKNKWWCKMLVGKYDTRSITHYPSKVKQTEKLHRNVFIVKKCSPGGCDFGQRDELSGLDIMHLAELYDCGKIY